MPSLKTGTKLLPPPTTVWPWLELRVLVESVTKALVPAPTVAAAVNAPTVVGISFR
ncbi:MAG: hypothetical protein ACPLGZ_00960 [Candidatus Pelagibacter ubique]